MTLTPGGIVSPVLPAGGGGRILGGGGEGGVMPGASKNSRDVVAWDGYASGKHKRARREYRRMAGGV